MSELVGPRYRFVIRRCPFGLRRKDGLFINVPNVLFVLNRYYADFFKEYGSQFEPQAALDEIDNEDSIFWERVFQSNYLQGLLFGYGAKNSFVFDWQCKADLSLSKILHKRQSIEPLLNRNISVADLQLPPAMVYSVGDEVLKKYCHERKAIIREFKGKDFEQTVKQWLKK